MISHRHVFVPLIKSSGEFPEARASCILDGFKGDGCRSRISIKLHSRAPPVVDDPMGRGNLRAALQLYQKPSAVRVYTEAPISDLL